MYKHHEIEYLGADMFFSLVDPCGPFQMLFTTNKFNMDKITKPKIAKNL
jgi:hypothetical protein